MTLEYGDLQLAFGTGKLFLTMNGFGTCCLVKDLELPRKAVLDTAGK